MNQDVRVWKSPTLQKLEADAKAKSKREVEAEARAEAESRPSGQPLAQNPEWGVDPGLLKYMYGPYPKFQITSINDSLRKQRVLIKRFEEALAEGNYAKAQERAQAIEASSNRLASAFGILGAGCRKVLRERAKEAAAKNNPDCPVSVD